MIDDLKKKCFVYGNLEVRLTGKVATKKLRSGKEDTIYEIIPSNPENGSNKIWVKLTELYEIKE